MTPAPAALAEADGLAAAFHARATAPALAYGIVAGGELVHSGGLGEAWGGGPAPGAATIFRIASMTKSFTAAAVLALRGDGALALDDPAAGYVPELAALPLPSPDSPELTIRHLLTMTGGFPPDDPWGDRQQGMPAGQFARLLAQGPRFAWAPGTRFDYSNLGYAILGRVIEAAAGRPYPQVVRGRLLRPLGMTATGFEAADFPAERLARGHRRTPGGWAELALDPRGAFAPMGGIFSTVADLARWVSGFAAAFPPGGPAAGGEHPLSRAARREMQLPQTGLPPPPGTRPPGTAGAGAWRSYGFGLFVAEDAAFGRIVSHSGGYPGFGSHMCWHPATGTGVVVLANSTYAPASDLAEAMLAAVLGHGGTGAAAGEGPALAPGGPWPETVAAQRQVSTLLRTWDDAIAGRLFTPNVALDQPYSERRAAIAAVAARIGEFRDDPGRPAEFPSPARCHWWLAGAHGMARVEIQLSPEPRPRVQSLVLAVPPAAGSPLQAVVTALVTLLNDGARRWPETLAAGPGLDTALALRQLRMAAAWAGRCTLGGYRAGDGASQASLELHGEHGGLVLTAAVGSGRGGLHRVEVEFGG